VAVRILVEMESVLGGEYTSYGELLADGSS
jgi:hypothetical protein